MSPTRKPKPPDKGAPPEHKPSRKVALEEVLRSLQDLVSNELATEPRKPSSDAETSAPRTKKTGPAEKPAVARSAFSADVLSAVPPAAAEQAAEPESITPEPVLPAPSPYVSADVIDELPDLGAEPLTTVAAPTTSAGSEVPVEGLQQELPYLDELPPVPSANQPAPTPEAAELPSEVPPLEELPHIDVTPDIIADHDTPTDLAPISMTAANPAPAEEVNWDDIPVLEEAVELAEETDTDAATHGTATSAMLPPAENARRLAIQVAARLNVELRKSGQAGLSSDIITRLARLLQEALAKGAANMENSPSDKH